MRVWSLLLVASCGGNEAGFEYEARFDVGVAVLTVDGVANPSGLSYVFESYEQAQAELVLTAMLTTSAGSGTLEIRPGHCADRVNPAIDIGTLLFEKATFAVIDGSAPTLYITSYECRGTKLLVIATP